MYLDDAVSLLFNSGGQLTSRRRQGGLDGANLVTQAVFRGLVPVTFR